MIYDVATKRILDKSKESILHRFLGISPSDILNILDLSEETVSIRRSDFPLIDEIEKRIYENNQIKTEEKADLLSALVMFAELRDKDLATRLLERRKDILIQSPIFEMIKEEGLKEGSRETAKKLLFDILNLKFNTIPARVKKSINKVIDIEILTRLHHSAVKSNSIKEFENEMKVILK